MTKEQSSFGPSAVAVIENKVAKTSCIFFSKPTQCQKHIRCQPWILQCLVHCERRHGSTNSHWCRIHHRRNTLRTTCPFSRSVVKLVPLSLPSWILNCSSKVLKRQSAPESLKFYFVWSCKNAWTENACLSQSAFTGVFEKSRVFLWSVARKC